MPVLSKLTDTELLEHLKKGDESALAVIFKRYWEPLFISAFNLFKDKETCEDIIQELFIKLWAKREQIEISVSLKAYLYASMRYEVFRQIRSGRAQESIFEIIEKRLYAPSPEHGLEHKELIALTASIVEALPPKCREVYKLSREEQLSHKEISEKLQISTKTVENHLTKALRVLRMSLGQLLSIEVLAWLLKL